MYLIQSKIQHGGDYGDAPDPMWADVARAGTRDDAAAYLARLEQIGEFRIISL